MAAALRTTAPPADERPRDGEVQVPHNAIPERFAELDDESEETEEFRL